MLAAAGGDAFAETMTNLSYPIGDLVLMVVSVAVLAMVRWRSDPIWWLLGLGAALFAAADTAYLFGLANETYVDGSWIDGLWMLGLTFMASAGSISRRQPAEDVRGFVALLVPILFSLAALVVLIVGTFVEMHPITIILASGCLVAAGVRTALTFEQTRELARTQVQAKTDDLSGLGNRRLLDENLPTMLGSLGIGQQLIITIVSVDHVSEINSVLGYSAGDTVVHTVGKRLQEALPADAVAARLGGVEIAILRMMRGADPKAVDRDTRALLGTLSSPVPMAETVIQIELSAGVAVAPVHATMPADLIRCAADALRLAKANRSEVEIYDPSQHAGSQVDLRLAPDLLRADSRGEFVTCYQPKFDIASGRPVALEGHSALAPPGARRHRGRRGAPAGGADGYDPSADPRPARLGPAPVRRLVQPGGHARRRRRRGRLGHPRRPAPLRPGEADQQGGDAAQRGDPGDRRGRAADRPPANGGRAGPVPPLRHPPGA